MKQEILVNNKQENIKIKITKKMGQKHKRYAKKSQKSTQTDQRGSTG